MGHGSPQPRTYSGGREGRIPGNGCTRNGLRNGDELGRACSTRLSRHLGGPRGRRDLQGAGKGEKRGRERRLPRRRPHADGTRRSVRLSPRHWRLSWDPESRPDWISARRGASVSTGNEVAMYRRERQLTPARWPANGPGRRVSRGARVGLQDPRRARVHLSGARTELSTAVLVDPDGTSLRKPGSSDASRGVSALRLGDRSSWAPGGTRLPTESPDGLAPARSGPTSDSRGALVRRVRGCPGTRSSRRRAEHRCAERRAGVPPASRGRRRRASDPRTPVEVGS